MLGFIVGGVCLLGLIKVLRHGRGCHRHHGWGARAGCGGGRWSRRWDGDAPYGRTDVDGDDEGPVTFASSAGKDFVLRGLFTRLQATPGQEKVIAAAFDEVRDAAKKANEERKKTMADLASAVRGDDFSQDSMGSAFARVDEVVETLRTAAFSSLSKVHDALDERQRKVLADLLERGPGRGFGFSH